VANSRYEKGLSFFNLLDLGPRRKEISQIGHLIFSVLMNLTQFEHHLKPFSYLELATIIVVV